jgi:hypothetical protein
MDKRVLVLKRAKFPKDGDDELFDPVYPVYSVFFH